MQSRRKLIRDGISVAGIASASPGLLLASESKEGCECDSILRFGQKTKIKAKTQFALLYDNQVGIEKRFKEHGGSGTFEFGGIGLGGSFSEVSRSESFKHFEHLDMRFLDSYVFEHGLGEGVAKAWLECMRKRNSGAWMSFDEVKLNRLKLGYGGPNHHPAKLLSVQTTEGLMIKGELPRKLSGEVTVGVRRKPGVNRAEGVNVGLAFHDGTTTTLTAYLPPDLPDTIAWTSPARYTRVPQIRRVRWEEDMPSIAEGYTAILQGYYSGASPADRAAASLSARITIVDEAGKTVDSMYWVAKNPQTRIPVTFQSRALRAGKYRLIGDMITESNEHYPGRSDLQLMLLTNIKDDSFTLLWDKPKLLGA